ncbi:MAG: alpha/beta hydrolase-fold protein [Candidatus Neomarinimicrobiota bacterium]
MTIVGNRPQTGNWNPAGIELEKVGPSTFQLQLIARIGDTLEYKFTRGSWATEALDPAGQIPNNYRLVVTGDTTIFHSIPDWRDYSYKPGAGITGTARYHSIDSSQLSGTRQLLVWLPPSYFADETAAYPVLYMTDGENTIDFCTAFRGREWQVDEVATALIDSGLIREFILVAVYSSADRRSEYSPVQRGRLFSSFLVNTVKPMIDSTYRTQPGPENTAVMGSSMGGIISFHLAWEYPQVFGMAGCLSPAFLVDEEEIVHRVAEYSGPVKPIKLYIDNGTVGLEASLQPAIDRMLPLLTAGGFREGENLIYIIANGAEHNEPAWAQRIHLPLKFFFGTGN